MDSSAPAAVWFLLTCSWTFVLASGDPSEIRLKPGQDVSLQCQGPHGSDITLLEWKKRDLEKYVFVWRNGCENKDDQNQLYKDRVQLEDPKMKNGNGSVVLKNITINDNGTYECQVGTYKCQVGTYKCQVGNGTERHLMNTIHLIVEPGDTSEPGARSSSVGLSSVSSSLVSVFVLLVLGEMCRS